MLQFVPPYAGKQAEAGPAIESAPARTRRGASGLHPYHEGPGKAGICCPKRAHRSLAAGAEVRSPASLFGVAGFLPPEQTHGPPAPSWNTAVRVAGAAASSHRRRASRKRDHGRPSMVQARPCVVRQPAGPPRFLLPRQLRIVPRRPRGAAGCGCKASPSQRFCSVPAAAARTRSPRLALSRPVRTRARRSCLATTGR